MSDLTEKQRLFVEGYNSCGHPAGYSSKTAYSSGQRLLKKVEIQKQIQIAMAEQSERTQIAADRCALIGK